MGLGPPQEAPQVAQHARLDGLGPPAAVPEQSVVGPANAVALAAGGGGVGQAVGVQPQDVAGAQGEVPAR